MNLSPHAIDVFLHKISPAASVLAGGLGMFMPIVVAFISQPRFTKRQKAVLSVISCVVASAIVCLAEGAFSGVNWFASLFIMLTITWLFFASFYKPTGVADWFEKATTVAGFAPLVAGLLGPQVSAIMSRANRYAATAQAPAVPDVMDIDAVNAPANAAVVGAILTGNPGVVSGAVTSAVTGAVSDKLSDMAADATNAATEAVSDAVSDAVSGAASKIFK